jgi:predicted ester cyclase
MTAAQMVEFFNAYVVSLNERRRAQALRIVAEELVHNGEPMTGPQWWERHIAANVAAVTGYRWAADEMIPCGDRMTIRYTDSGTLAEPWFGLTAIGTPIRFREYVVYTVRAARIVEIWSVFDHWSLVQQTAR